jgi:hypothetical protein
LRTIGTKTEDGLVAISKCDTINQGPHMSEAPRGEFDTWRETELRMTRELRVGCAILQEVIYGEVTFQ